MSAENYDDVIDRYQQALDELDDEESKSVLLTLLMKREVDGLNGRVWDAAEHLKWEGRATQLLAGLHAFRSITPQPRKPHVDTRT